MTNLEKLNEENRDMSLENLTEEQASDAIKFSPELARGEMGRTEYLKSLVNNLDINEIKNFIATEPNINLLDEKETLMNDYGFTEEEIEEGVAYLEDVKTNPDMLEYDIENELTPFPRLIVVGVVLLMGTGASVTKCSSERHERKELERQVEEEERKRREREERMQEREEEREANRRNNRRNNRR